MSTPESKEGGGLLGNIGNFFKRLLMGVPRYTKNFADAMPHISRATKSAARTANHLGTMMDVAKRARQEPTPTPAPRSGVRYN